MMAPVKLEDARDHHEREVRAFAGTKKNGTIAQFLAILAKRAEIQRYFEVMRNPWHPYRWRLEQGAGRKKGRLTSAMLYDCGCILPYGYPLYRRLRPCARHMKTLGGMVEASGSDEVAAAWNEPGPDGEQ